MMGIVVAVSGTSGAGKSTLMRHLAELQGGAALMHFDDYIELGTDAGDIRQWVAAGAPADAIQTPRLADDLAALRSNRAVHPPGRNAPVAPAGLILLEEPFGRARSAIAPLIDLALHLELPPDIALARRSLRRARAYPGPDSPDPIAANWHAETLEDLVAQFQAYLGPQRQAYRLAEAQAKALADVILDGLQPLPDLAAQAQRAIASLPDSRSQHVTKKPENEEKP
jgi:uridine kinase